MLNEAKDLPGAEVAVDVDTLPGRQVGSAVDPAAGYRAGARAVVERGDGGN